ncbi:glycolate oxidase subunit GlcE [Ideonella sp. 4Y11]|uniref:Glycolate oxidase subunit GlcE n=1 Tax=Ideonella aquatica TaxID=2824119 RepID=A0A941BMW2_9BURK|nr:glycolate oxidase subunit GlcE [Ideonella aquatica]MBQ0961289.1 glycolate oxidase subunit GlcE [Ideonella aquatica]
MSELHDPHLQALIERVREAAAREQPLCIRGSGSKDFYGGPLVGEPLDVQALRGISSYEPTELVITARAGTPLAELEAALAEQGQCLPFEPPRFGESGGTLGGMVAAGLAGPARAAVGGVRDYVLGASLLNGQAELMSFGGQVMKNVAGYDVSRLLAGSMGVLGVICEVSLKVLPLAPATLTLRFDLDQASALRRLNDWAGQPLPLNASAWWDGTLVVRLRGAQAAVAAAHQRLGGEEIPTELAQGFWDGLRDQRDEFFQLAQQAVADGATLWRLSVAPTAPKLELPQGEHQLIEWGGALRWVVSREAPARLMALAADARGHASVYRSAHDHPGAAQPLTEASLRIHRAIKRAFDPAGIFNRQRLLPEL